MQLASCATKASPTFTTPNWSRWNRNSYSPYFLSGLRVVPMGEVLSVLAWTDMPGGRYASEIERRVSGRFILTRTVARKLMKDLGAILNAGN